MARGFVIDNPKGLVRTSGDNFAVINASSGEVTFNSESLEINGGWSNYPIADLETKKTIEVKLVDTEWDLSGMKMTSGGTLTEGDSEFTFFGTSYIVSETGTITIPSVVIANSIKIDGYTEVTTAPAANQFKVTIGAESTEVSFVIGDAGKVVLPSYKVSVTNSTKLAVKTNDVPTSGEIFLTFPIYANSTSSEADIAGYMQITIFKAKIKQELTIGGSYKSNSSFTYSFKALDNNRPDGLMYQVTYIDKAAYVG